MKSLLAAGVAVGLITPNAPPLHIPRPAIIKLEKTKPELILPGISMFGFHKRALKLTYINSSLVATTTAVIDFGNFNAPAAGLMVVGCRARGAGAFGVTSISIGGTNGTLISDGGTSTDPVALVYRAVAAGNNNVTVTWSTTHSGGGGVAVWLIENYLSATPFNTAVPASGSASTGVATLNLAAGGCAIYMASHANTDAAGWSSATERLDDNTLGGGAVNTTAADKLTPSDVTSNAETVTWSAATTRQIVGASWR